jgi:hypothetical protein
MANCSSEWKSDLFKTLHREILEHRYKFKEIIIVRKHKKGLTEELGIDLNIIEEDSHRNLEEKAGICRVLGWGQALHPQQSLLFLSFVTWKCPDNLSEPGFCFLKVESLLSMYVIYHLKSK